MNHIFALIT